MKHESISSARSAAFDQFEEEDCALLGKPVHPSLPELRSQEELERRYSAPDLSQSPYTMGWLVVAACAVLVGVSLGLWAGSSIVPFGG